MLHYVVKYPKVAVLHPPLLVMLHGYGSNEEDLFSFADNLTDRFLVISARAPLSLPWGGFAWYNIDFTSTSGRFGDTEQAAKSVQLVADFIREAQHKYQTAPNKTLILGFSQGAIISYAVSLTFPDIAQHICALSGYVNQEITPAHISSETIKDLEIFASHGTDDPVIPVEWARASLDWLKKKHLKTEFTEYVGMGHGINPQCFTDMMRWIGARYAKLAAR